MLQKEEEDTELSTLAFPCCAERGGRADTGPPEAPSVPQSCVCPKGAIIVPLFMATDGLDEELTKLWETAK